MKRTVMIQLDQIPSGTAQQRKIAMNNGMIRSYPSKSLQRTRAIYDKALAPITPEHLTGAIKLTLVFYYATSDKKKRQLEYKVTRPDCDNLAKVFIDSLMHHGWFEDDSQICTLSVSKRWSDRAMILMEIEEEVPSGR